LLRHCHVSWLQRCVSFPIRRRSSSVGGSAANPPRQI
jgi:hypothetical protein